jgi:hypothetical protein
MGCELGEVLTLQGRLPVVPLYGHDLVRRFAHHTPRTRRSQRWVRCESIIVSQVRKVLYRGPYVKGPKTSRSSAGMSYGDW